MPHGSLLAFLRRPVDEWSSTLEPYESFTDHSTTARDSMDTSTFLPHSSNSMSGDAMFRDPVFGASLLPQLSTSQGLCYCLLVFISYMTVSAGENSLPPLPLHLLKSGLNSCFLLGLDEWFLLLQ